MSQKNKNSAWEDNFGRAALRSLQAIILLAITAILIVGLTQLSSIFIPLLIAVILASGFAPVLSYLRSESLDKSGSELGTDIEHRYQNGLQKVFAFFMSKRPHMGATSSTVITLVGFIAIIAGVVWGISENIQGQWTKLQASLISGVDDLVAWVNHLPFEVNVDQIEKIKDQAIAFATSEQFSSFAISGVGSVVSFGTAIVLMIVMLFFFMKDGSQIWNFLLLPLSESGRKRGARLGQDAVSTLGQYVRGASIVAAADAICIWVVLMVLDVPLALSLAVLTFILSFIPFVGATLGGILAALVALVSQGPIVCLIVIIAIIAINQLEGNFLQPVVMGRSLSLHPLVVFLALIVGTSLAGLVGAVLSVPIAAVVWKWLSNWNGKGIPVSWLAREKSLLAIAPAGSTKTKKSEFIIAETEDNVASVQDSNSDNSASANDTAEPQNPAENTKK